MESRKIRVVVYLFFIFSTMLLINWYSNVGKISIKIENQDTYVSDDIANQKMGSRYDVTKRYFWRKKVKTSEVNSLIPFKYNIKVLSESKYVFYSK